MAAVAMMSRSNPNPHVRIVGNGAGVTGGAQLWEQALDEHFGDQPNAQ